LTSEKAFAFVLPAVVPVPNEWKAGKFAVGGVEPPKKTIVYTNNGPGAWTGVLVFRYIPEAGAAQEIPFKVAAGAIPCNKKLKETQNVKLS
jgi:hypothetical protein